MVLSAVVGASILGPNSEVNLLEIAIPEDWAGDRSEFVREPHLLFNVAKVRGWMADEKADCF
jgi:hypothetical protein